MIDLVAILPFQLMIGEDDHSHEGSDVTKIVRVLRLGRLNKILKLLKLMRILRFLRNDGQVNSITRDLMHFSLAAERLFFFIVISILTFHVVSCLLIFSAEFIMEQYPDSKTWMKDDLDDYTDFPPSRLYLCGIYYTASISYGNIVAYNDFERFFSLAIMVLGGLLMTYSISVLSQIIVSMDQGNALFQEKVEVLNRLQHDYMLPLDLYIRLKKSLRYKY